MTGTYRGFHLLELLTLCVAQYLQLPLARLGCPFPGTDHVLQVVIFDCQHPSDISGMIRNQQDLTFSGVSARNSVTF